MKNLLERYLLLIPTSILILGLYMMFIYADCKGKISLFGDEWVNKYFLILALGAIIFGMIWIYNILKSKNNDN